MRLKFMFLRVYSTQNDLNSFVHRMIFKLKEMILLIVFKNLYEII